MLLSMLKRLRRPARSAPPTPPVTLRLVAPGTQIAYDPSLIGYLVDQHGGLLRRLAEVKTASDHEDYRAIVAALVRVRRALQQHLLDENVRLYTYLGHCLRDEPDTLRHVQRMRQKKAALCRGLGAFCQRHVEHGISEASHRAFEMELDDAIVDLGERLQREETTLYTLYRPPSG